MDTLQNEICESGIGFGVHARRNQVAPAEATTFYRILFGHQHEIAIDELEVRGPERVMVGKGMCSETQSQARELREEPLGIPYPGDRMQLSSRKIGGRHRHSVLANPVKARRREPHSKRTGSRFATVDDCRIHPAIRRLTQRSCRKHQAVTETALILDCYLEIAMQTIVLEPVVADNHIALAIGREQGASGRNAIGTDPHRATGTLGKQQRLVADPRGVVSHAHPMGPDMNSPVSPAENARTSSFAAQNLDQREDEGRFSRAAHGEVPDNDHRDMKAHRTQHADAIEQPPQSDQKTKGKVRRKQQD